MGKSQDTYCLGKILKPPTVKPVCEIALAWPNGRLVTTRGEVAGVIARKPRGTRGFGYDPVFWVPAYEATVAELDLAVKNRISHRGQALKQLKEILVRGREEFFAAPPP